MLDAGWLPVFAQLCTAAGIWFSGHPEKRGARILGWSLGIGANAIYILFGIFSGYWAFTGNAGIAIMLALNIYRNTKAADNDGGTGKPEDRAPCCL